MICHSCGDKGMIRVPWTDDKAEDDFAICLCDVGQDMRNTRNAGKETGYALWQVWCAQNQVQPSRIYLMEEILTPAELAERGFGPASAVPVDREAALLAAGKTRKAKL